MAVENLSPLAKPPKVEQIRAGASNARSYQEPMRHVAIKALMAFRFRAADRFIGPQFLIPEAELFEAAYDDPLGREYWKAWVMNFRSREELSELFAAHMASSQRESRLLYSIVAGYLAKSPGPSFLDDIEWLIENPDTRRYVPVSLIEYLHPRVVTATLESQNESPKIVEQTPSRIRGRRPLVRNRVVEAMRKIPRAELDCMGEKVMEGKFQASRDTCRKAREIVLTEIVAN